MRKGLCCILALLFIASVSACGSAGTAASKHGSSVKTVIKASALAASLNIGGVDMSIAMPQGVTPVMNPDGSINESATVEFISTAPAAYKISKATYSSVDSLLEFSVINLAGFNTEDQIVVHLVILPGTTPKESDFSIKSSAFYDKVTGDVIGGLNPTLSTTIQ